LVSSSAAGGAFRVTMVSEVSLSVSRNRSPLSERTAGGRLPTFSSLDFMAEELLRPAFRSLFEKPASELPDLLNVRCRRRVDNLSRQISVVRLEAD